MGHPFTTIRGGLVTDNSNEEVPDGQVRYYLYVLYKFIVIILFHFSIDFIKYLNQNLLLSLPLSLLLSLSLATYADCWKQHLSFLHGLVRVTDLGVNPSNSFYILESVVHEPTLTTVITVFLGAIHHQLFGEVREGSLLEESLALRGPGGGKGPALLLALDGSYGSFRLPVHCRREGYSKRASEEASFTWHVVVSVVPFLRLPEAVVLCCEFRGLHVGECIHFKSPAPLAGVGIVFLDRLLVRLPDGAAVELFLVRGVLLPVLFLPQLPLGSVVESSF